MNIKPFKISLRNALVPFFFAVIMMLISILTGQFAEERVDLENQLKFENQVEEFTSIIESRINLYTNVLYHTQSFFSASESISRADYRKYFANIDIRQRYPGISGISFARKVKSVELNAFQQNVKNDKTLEPEGYPNFKVFPESVKDTFYIIDYFEPYNKNSTGFGFDVSSDPSRNEAINEAINSGQPAVSKKVNVKGQDGDYLGFIIVLPVYKPNTSIATVTDRQANTMGMVWGVFRVNTLFENILSNEAFKGLHFQVYEEKEINEDTLLYNSNGQTVSNGFEFSNTITVANKDWNMHFQQDTREANVTTGRARKIGIYFIGVILSLLIYSTLHFYITSKRRALQLIQTTEFKLNEAENLFATIVKEAPLVIFLIDKKRKLSLIEGKGLGKFGIEKKLLGTDYKNILKNENLPDAVEKAFRGEEARYVKEHNNYTFDVSLSPIRNTQTGEVESVMGVGSDITDRTNNEEQIKERNEELERINSIMVNRELQMVKLKEELKALKEDIK